jgi:hypothetical protein
MYVMSSLPKSQQSIAGGLFQMITRLALTIGMASTTAIYDSAVKAPEKGFHAGDPVRPYSDVYWFATAGAALSIVFVPFLTIKTQGSKTPDVEDVTHGPTEKSAMAVSTRN